MDTIHMSDPDLYCYSLFYFVPYDVEIVWELVERHEGNIQPQVGGHFYFIPYDPEDIWSLVQRHQGNIQPQPGGHYDFWIHRDYASILVLAFPMLRRQYQKDLYT